MGSTILHFFTLPELADELEPGSVVRVETVVRTHESKTPGIAARIAEVHARAMPPVPEGLEVSNGAQILTFMLYVGMIQTLHGRPSNEQEASELEEELQRAEKAVRWFLATRDLRVRPGLIDIGGAEPVRGTWAGLEVEPDGG